MRLQSRDAAERRVRTEQFLFAHVLYSTCASCFLEDLTSQKGCSVLLLKLHAPPITGAAAPTPPSHPPPPWCPWTAL